MTTHTFKRLRAARREGSTSDVRVLPLEHARPRPPKSTHPWEQGQLPGGATGVRVFLPTHTERRA